MLIFFQATEKKKHYRSCSYDLCNVFQVFWNYTLANCKKKQNWFTSSSPNLNISFAFLYIMHVTLRNQCHCALLTCKPSMTGLHTVYLNLRNWDLNAAMVGKIANKHSYVLTTFMVHFFPHLSSTLKWQIYCMENIFSKYLSFPFKISCSSKERKSWNGMTVCKQC